MLNTTQITNPACVTRTERLTADEKELRGHCIKGHKTKLELQDDKSCHECVTPASQALMSQKEGALEKPDVRAHAKQWANKDELQSITDELHIPIESADEDEEMGIYTLDKCTSCDRLTDTRCMNLFCEWCCESQKCECVAVPIPKPRSMLATRGTDTEQARS
jgi:hypothetical protein